MYKVHLNFLENFALMFEVLVYINGLRYPCMQQQGCTTMCSGKLGFEILLIMY